MKDLVILVSDKNMEVGVRELLARGPSLGIAEVSSEIYVHPERDPGCLLKGHEFLRPFSEDYRYALLMFDHEGCGRQEQTREGLEAEVEGELARSGWQNRAAAVVIDPELENWVWSDSPHVERVLAWEGRAPALRDWLQAIGIWPEQARKPARPKEALEETLRVVRKPRSSSLYSQLAGAVSVDRCSDLAFIKFKTTLRTWFPHRSTWV